MTIPAPLTVEDVIRQLEQLDPDWPVLAADGTPVTDVDLQPHTRTPRVVITTHATTEGENL